MTARRISISEARRRLPELVKTIGRDGGRVDITYRGEPRASLLRISDVKGAKALRSKARDIPAALQVELSIPAEQLVDTIRELRGRQGRPRADWLSTPSAGAHEKRARRSSRR